MTMTKSLWTSLAADETALSWHSGGWRTISPTETLQRIRPLLSRIGVTRVADITGLDRIGIPVFQAIRPNSRNISVSQGKGATRTQARASAVFEALECFHAEEVPACSDRDTVADLLPYLGYDPFSLPLVREVPFVLLPQPEIHPFAQYLSRAPLLREDIEIEWCAATNLISGAETRVPRELCLLNYVVKDEFGPQYFQRSSNGLASGNSIAEAILHGLCEVIERDAAWRNCNARYDGAQCIRLDTISSMLCRKIVRQYQQAHFRLQVVDITGPSGLSCFEVFIMGDDGRPFCGRGCHVCRDTALLRALTEAAQGRLAHITGSRDDLKGDSYPACCDVEETHEAVFAPTSIRAFQDVVTHSVNGRTSDICKAVASFIHNTTGAPPLAVDLRRSAFDIPVVFIIAPGLAFRPPH